jgi:hypothetical protein
LLTLSALQPQQVSKLSPAAHHVGQLHQPGRWFGFRSVLASLPVALPN